MRRKILPFDYADYDDTDLENSQMSQTTMVFTLDDLNGDTSSIPSTVFDEE